MKYSLFYFIVLSLLSVTCSLVWAQTGTQLLSDPHHAGRAEAGTEPAGSFDLYGEAAPDDAACIRLVNAVEDSGPLKIELGINCLSTGKFPAISAYRPVRPDIYQVRSGERQQEVIAALGKYYTVAFTPGGLLVFNDPAFTDPARAQLFLYNLSDLPNVKLMTADGQTLVIDYVAPGESKEVKVNAVPVTFALFADEELLQTLSGLTLKRGQSYSIFLLPQGNGVQAFLVQAAVDAD